MNPLPLSFRTKDNEMPGRIQNSGPKVKMPDCADCHQPWFMYQSEREWWEKEGQAGGLTLPKRCAPCRELRKQNTSIKICEDLKSVSASVLNQEFLGQEAELSNQLNLIAERILKLEKKPVEKIQEPQHTAAA